MFYYCDVTVKQLENWLKNVLGICVKLSPVDFLSGITYKRSFSRLHLLNYIILQAKYFIYRSHDKHDIFFQVFLKDLKSAAIFENVTEATNTTGQTSSRWSALPVVL